ncbi:MAG: PD-(D/E)XK nuclease-like domain-containing protein [Flavobacteriales bacterium]|nr:PD-(D/E)XK nuclease-like domain-containing protein [Flavobacteriales bacterium]
MELEAFNPSKEFKPGLYDGVSNSDYHASSAIGSTSLKIAGESMHLYKLSIDGNLPFNVTDAIRLGTTVHKRVLEPETFNEDIAIKPDLPWSKANKIILQEFADVNQGKTIITKDQAEISRLMCESVRSHPEVIEMGLLSNSNEFESSGFYVDQGTGLSCKYRPDVKSSWMLADLKTTVDVSPSGFSRTIQKFGYHISAAHYLEGERQLFGLNHEQFIFIVVSSKYPFSVAVYTLDECSLQRGYELRERYLARINDCTEKGVWPLMNGGGSQSIGIPNWGYYD